MELYVLVTPWRLVFSRRMRPENVELLLSKYAPTAILPSGW